MSLQFCAIMTCRDLRRFQKQLDIKNQFLELFQLVDALMVLASRLEDRKLGTRNIGDRMFQEMFI